MKNSLLKRALSTASAKLGLALMLLTILTAVGGPFIAPYTETEMISLPFDSPSEELLFGADSLGRDVASRFLFGGFSLVWMSIGSAVIALLLGAAMGLSAAYHRGWLDELLMRLIDVKMAFPTTVFALLIVTVTGTSEALLVVIVGVSQAPGMARVLRGAAMAVVDQEYVQYARTIGMGAGRIILFEVLPNVASPLLAEFGLRLMWSISAIAGLSFLGFGIQAPNADWGMMINENRNALSIQIWAVLVPMAGIAVFTIGGNLFAEGIARAVGRTEESSK